MGIERRKPGKGGDHKGGIPKLVSANVLLHLYIHGRLAGHNSQYPRGICSSARLFPSRGGDDDTNKKGRATKRVANLNLVLWEIVIRDNNRGT